MRVPMAQPNIRRYKLFELGGEESLRENLRR